MAQGTRTPPDQRQRIVRLLHGGASVGETARQCGCAKSTVSTIAAQEGLALERLRTSKAAQAVRDFGHAERVAAINELAARVREAIDEGGLSAKDLRDIAVALGVTIDKARLERGEATSRHEQATVHIYVPQTPRLSRPAAQVVDVAPAQLASGQGTQG